ncbi:hypothetical protein ACTHGU_08820 [Chitinophagaceae bacterium MMS25-I14]
MRKRFLIFFATVFMLLPGLLEVAVAKHRHVVAGNALKKPDTATFISNFDIGKLLYDSSYGSAVKTGELKDTNLHEASGIAASRRYAHLWWSHNDGGNTNDIFLINAQGSEQAIVTLNGCINRDWEDIAVGAGPEEGKHYIYIAETGDNHLKYNTYCIYRLQEPALKLKKGETIRAAATADKISFVYPDSAHNAEALLLDPLTKDIYIITKSKVKAEAIVYVAAYPQSIHHTNVLRKLGVLPILKVTAGAISPDGHEIVIKNLDHIFYWKRPQGTSVANALKTMPALLPYVPEPQGEAIDWTPDGKALYTLSEKKGVAAQAIYQHIRK